MTTEQREKLRHFVLRPTMWISDIHPPPSLVLCDSKRGAHQRYTPIPQPTPCLIKTVMQAIKQHPEFVTNTCLDWKHVLQRLWQKLDYIHANPVKAGLCIHATEYRYSSASFYFEGKEHWDFLSHMDG